MHTPAPHEFAVAEQRYVHVYTLRDPAARPADKRYIYDFAHSIPRAGA